MQPVLTFGLLRLVPLALISSVELPLGDVMRRLVILRLAIHSNEEPDVIRRSYDVAVE